MPCLINWDAKNPPPLTSVDLGSDGCIINWLKTEKDMASVNPTGCIVKWDAQTDIAAAVAKAQDGCIVKWDAGTNIVSMSKAGASAKTGCIINWLDVDEKTLIAAADGGCIINW